MAVLLSLDNISKAFGAKALFKDVCLTIDQGDRIGIIGDNGTGKSTLTKIMINIESADSGNISRKKNLKTAYIPQVSEHAENSNVWDIVSSKATIGLKDVDVKTATALSLVGFTDFTAKVSILSGGWKKRLDIACGIVNEPELLILDEPTNHLDFAGLVWLENFLGSADFTWVMVSHDRSLLERSVNRIVEINKRYDGYIFQSHGKYHDFLEKRIQYMEQQKNLEIVMTNKVKREVEWLRRGPKARATKAQYRINEAQTLIAELSNLRSKMRSSEAEIDFSSSNRKTKELIKIKNLSKSFGNKNILKDFSLNFTNNLRIGLLGGNGVGKSTLLKLLSKKIDADSGKIEHVEGLKIVYFEQGRDSLDLNKTLRQVLADGSDSVIFKDRPVHLTSWIKKFGFMPEQADSVLAKLSGGEQARALIAKLMLESADVLFLDEPTNDLDVTTIETLEDSLLEFDGLLVMVSHDRVLISRICDLFIGFTNDGNVELFADYEQWEKSLKADKKEAKKQKGTKEQAAKVKTKLSYKEKMELQEVEKQIEILEERIRSIHTQMSDSQNFSDFVLLNNLTEELRSSEETLEKTYKRWEELSVLPSM
jgi:ABC transport system ATP-binding/permease protein